MAKDREVNGQPKEEKELREWMAVKGTRAAVFAGAAALMGWRTGKMLAEAEYDAGIRKFLGQPVGGVGKRV